MNEADTCRKYVVPKLQAAGWDNAPYSIADEREKRTWWPSLSEREELHPEGGSEESFPISDTRWQKATTQGWRLVTGLQQGEGPPAEKDQLALEMAKPESGSFILVSLRRRRKEH